MLSPRNFNKIMGCGLECQLVSDIQRKREDRGWMGIDICTFKRKKKNRSIKRIGDMVLDRLDMRIVGLDMYHSSVCS